MFRVGSSFSKAQSFRWVSTKQRFINSAPFEEFQKQLRQRLTPSQLCSDPLRLLAYGTDASFYRLIPQLVVHLTNENDVKTILPLASQYNVPVTFRAAGTSLSGQAITDSVLLKLQPEHWKKYTIINDDHSKQKATRILVQPGLIGGEINRILHPYSRKIGPDPSSIDSCMIGGITANNSSGMCCGVANNSYNTISDVRLVFVDGSVLDTSNKQSKEEFIESHPQLIDGIISIRNKIMKDEELVEKINRKFKIKCKFRVSCLTSETCKIFCRAKES